MPERIQRSRAKGWRMPPNTVYVGRGTRWGNPCRIGDTMFMGTKYTLEGEAVIRPATAEDVLIYFRERVVPIALKHNPDWLAPLRGKNLACWCPAGQPCHADILLELANRG
jgi:hypothetical protein